MVPKDLLYTKEHEWIKKEGIFGIIGITHHAQSQLGEIVYVELPEIDQELEQFAECGVIESVKSTSDLYSPVSGKVTEFNETLTDNPGLINNSPYADGWLYKVELKDESELGNLLSSEDYEKLISEE